jgi:hypothetical protein
MPRYPPNQKDFRLSEGTGPLTFLSGIKQVFLE